MEFKKVKVQEIEPWWHYLKSNRKTWEKARQLGMFDYEDSKYRPGREGEKREKQDMEDGDFYIGEFKKDSNPPVI